jgi:hypothetical protein
VHIEGEAMEQKYNRPTHLSKEPQGTLWCADLEGGKELFIQTADNKNRPHWIRVGEFLERAFCLEIHNHNFLDAALKLYNHHKDLN